MLLVYVLQVFVAFLVLFMFSRSAKQKVCYHTKSWKLSCWSYGTHQVDLDRQRWFGLVSCPVYQGNPSVFPPNGHLTAGCDLPDAQRR